MTYKTNKETNRIILNIYSIL